MRVKREYLTEKVPKPRIIERVVEKVVPRTVEKLVVDPAITKKLSHLEELVREILAHEAEPEGPEPDIIGRIDRLEASLVKATPSKTEPQPKQAYQFDVVRNAAGDIERIVAKPLSGGGTIYGGARQ